MVALIVIALFAAFYFFRLRSEPPNIPVIITGLVPSNPGAETGQDRGSAVLLFYGEPAGRAVAEEGIISRGFADARGEFHATLPSSATGRTITCRTRHAAYVFRDDELIVPAHGLVHFVELRPDGVYEGTARGAMVEDLRQHQRDAKTSAYNYDANALAKLRNTQTSFGAIPAFAWLLLYLLLVAAFAIDYWVWADQFNRRIDGPIDAIYFSAVTITTLGYGDITPTSIEPKVLVSFQSLLGILLMGLFLNSLFHDRRSLLLSEPREAAPSEATE